MMQVYVTINDTISFRLNKAGEKEYFTVEGPRVLSNHPIDKETFAAREQAIQALWPGSVIRFEKDAK